MLDSLTVKCITIKHIGRTPVLQSRYRNDLCGTELFSKCENFQEVDVFNVRGACNSVFGLSQLCCVFGYHLEVPGVFKGQSVSGSITGGNDDLDRLPWTLG